MLGIAEIHLGHVDAGLRRLQEAIAAGPEEAGHHCHRRELAIAHLLAGNAGEGARVATKLCEEVPDMKRKWWSSRDYWLHRAMPTRRADG